jgi:hypothetical protein
MPLAGAGMRRMSILATMPPKGSREIQERVHGMRNPRVDPVRDEDLGLRVDRERRAQLSTRSRQQRYRPEKKCCAGDQRDFSSAVPDEGQARKSQERDQDHTGRPLA